MKIIPGKLNANKLLDQTERGKKQLAFLSQLETISMPNLAPTPNKLPDQTEGGKTKLVFSFQLETISMQNIAPTPN